MKIKINYKIKTKQDNRTDEEKRRDEILSKYGLYDDEGRWREK